MSDRLRGLPQFPSEDSNRYEREMGPKKHAPDRFVDRFRHAWPVYTIFGVLLCLWLMALLVTGLSSNSWGAFWVVFIVPLIAFLSVIRFWWWSQFFSPHRKND